MSETALCRPLERVVRLRWSGKLIQRVATQKIDDAEDTRERCYRGAVHALKQISNSVVEMSRMKRTGWVRFVVKSYNGKLSGSKTSSRSRWVLEHAEEKDPTEVFGDFMKRLREMANPSFHGELTIDISIDAGNVSASITEGEQMQWDRNA